MSAFYVGYQHFPHNGKCFQNGLTLLKPFSVSKAMYKTVHNMVGVTSLKWFITQLALISVITNVNDTSVPPPQKKPEQPTAMPENLRILALTCIVNQSVMPIYLARSAVLKMLSRNFFLEHIKVKHKHRDNFKVQEKCISMWRQLMLSIHFKIMCFTGRCPSLMKTENMLH